LGVGLVTPPPKNIIVMQSQTDQAGQLFGETQVK
jgi:hypothetical protein